MEFSRIIELIASRRYSYAALFMILACEYLTIYHLFYANVNRLAIYLIPNTIKFFKLRKIHITRFTIFKGENSLSIVRLQYCIITTPCVVPKYFITLLSFKQFLSILLLPLLSLAVTSLLSFLVAYSYFHISGIIQYVLSVVSGIFRSIMFFWGPSTLQQHVCTLFLFMTK